MTYPNISSMQWLRARDVLPGEATHFTPWLSENLDLLADAAGLSELTLEDTEVAVDEKRLDILASGIDDDGDAIPVIIENQYGVTDHRHLGQVITYLAQQQKGLAIWIAEDFSQAHLAAVDFLNRTSIEGVGYLLVRVRFTHALDGYQVHFEVVSRPNSFIKQSGTANASRANPDKVKFMSAVLGRVQRPLELAGLKNIRMHTYGSYLQVRLPASSGLRAVNGYLSFRVTTKDATVLLGIDGMETGEENLAALEEVRHRYGHLTEGALPSPVKEWKRGNGGAIRAYAESTLTGQGYQAGSVDEAAAWAEKMFSEWFKLLKDNPIPDIEAAAVERLAGGAGSSDEEGDD